MTTAVAKKPRKTKSKVSKKALPRPAKLTLAEAEEIAAGRPFELIDGRVVYKMPDLQHSRIQSRFSKVLGNYFDKKQIGEVFTELTHRLWPENPHEGRLPDLSIILNENIQAIERYPINAPDIAIEIVSLESKWTDLFDKAKLYLQKGSRFVWIADPYQKGVMIVTKTGRHWVDDILICPELLPDLSITLEDIFI